MKIIFHLTVLIFFVSLFRHFSVYHFSLADWLSIVILIVAIIFSHFKKRKDINSYIFPFEFNFLGRDKTIMIKNLKSCPFYVSVSNVSYATLFLDCKFILIPFYSFSILSMVDFYFLASFFLSCFFSLFFFCLWFCDCCRCRKFERSVYWIITFPIKNIIWKVR